MTTFKSMSKSEVDTGVSALPQLKAKKSQSGKFDEHHYENKYGKEKNQGLSKVLLQEQHD